ncbi:MAG: NAD(P)H-dependent oxidoreductase [Acidimicrobiales bacterium]|nr:NAD(P)H-dependent oxidoreductase [Acidimicrobiales bacterium]
MSLIAVNASPSSSSTTHALAQAAVELAREGHVLNVGELDAEALLLRRTADDVEGALTAICGATILVVATPVNQATYGGLLKVLFDQLPPSALAGTACVLAAAGATRDHFLSLDTGLRAMLASLDGWTVPTVVYATGDDVDESGRPRPPVLASLQRALGEAYALERAFGG